MPRPGDAALFARPASKLLGRHLGYNCDDLLALALPAIGDLVSVTHSNGKGLVEASALGVSKASVVAESRPTSASAAIGPRVRRHAQRPAPAHLGRDLLAVANAHPEVLAAATHVIGSNDDDGVAEYLERIFPSRSRRAPAKYLWGRSARS